MGMALAAWEGRDRADLPDYLRKAAHTLSHARPTTVARMEAITEGCLKAGLEALACGQPADEAIFRYALGLLDVYKRQTLKRWRWGIRPSRPGTRRCAASTARTSPA